MADQIQQTPAMSEEAFFAERQRLWGGFTTGIIIAVAVVTVGLILLAFITL